MALEVLLHREQMDLWQEILLFINFQLGQLFFKHAPIVTIQIVEQLLENQVISQILHILKFKELISIGNMLEDKYIMILMVR
jgi:hypothetical protein